ncbi:MAG: ROK family protein [Clostridia bacterium]|nr:ROK family protein [Clostridia bacterium]
MLTIGVDVGGTNIKSALIEVGDATKADTYKILKFISVPTEAKRGRDFVVANIIKSIEQFDWKDCGAIAVATAGTVDWDSGEVTYATATIPNYTGTALSKILSEHFGKRVVVINDAVSALIGESFLGAGKKKSESVMMFTIGTGLGASLLTGKTLDSKTIIDTALGHYILHDDGRQCTCGQKGCAEQYVSATALKRYGNENLYQLFHTSDVAQKKILSNFYKDLTRVISRSTELYSPSLVVIGGGVIEMSEYWWQSFLKEYRSKCSTPVSPASLGNKAGVLGSVYASINGVFKNQ